MMFGMQNQAIGAQGLNSLSAMNQMMMMQAQLEMLLQLYMMAAFHSMLQSMFGGATGMPGGHAPGGHAPGGHAPGGSSGGRMRPGGHMNPGASRQTSQNSIQPSSPGVNSSAPAGSLNERIANAAESNTGMNSSHGPGGGNLACAWAVNKVLQSAGIRPVGSNTNYVPSMEKDLQQRGQRIDPSQARPGDIVIASNTGHVGIVGKDGRVISNSSSRRSFAWKSDMNFDGYYGGQSRVYRLNA